MRRLTITLLLVVLIAIFGLGFLLDSLFERYQSGADDELAQVQSFASGLAIAIDQADSAQSFIAQWPENNAYKIALENIAELQLPSELAQQFASGEPLLLESETGILMRFLLPTHDAVLSVETDKIMRNKNTRMALVFTGLFYLGTLLLVLLWLKPLLYRLNLLRRTTLSFGAGQLESRVSSQGFSYIRDIENDFNAMAEQIQQLIEDNKLLSSAVSHDLRTPLARLRFGIDTLAETESSDARTQYLGRINNDLNEMESLVNSLLRYARLDNVMDGVAKEPVSLQALLRECVAQYYDAPISVHFDESKLAVDDKLVINGCIEHLATLFNNLIQNALRHADTILVIDFNRRNSSIEVCFCDDGAGIPVAMRELVLKPFQRGELIDGQVAGSKSYGLGLAVVSRIARHHNAVVDIQQSERLGGARIGVLFGV